MKMCTLWKCVPYENVYPMKMRTLAVNGSVRERVYMGSAMVGSYQWVCKREDAYGVCHGG